MTTVLIANRGEIAVRIARAARDAGITSVAVYSDADADALHTRVADRAFRLQGTSAADTYMNVPALLDVAARAGADAVHPGYGFLAENADFARAVRAAGLTWIGPDPETIDVLGDKVAAREIARSVGAPLAPGSDGPVTGWEDARDFATEHGLPIAVKAAFGGGGRGMRVARRMEDVEDAFTSAVRESQAAFGRGECFVEKFLDRPRHVEAQVLADTHGQVVVLGLRDCSLQRRNQKLVEEAPAPFLTPDQRAAVVRGAREVVAAADYVGAGTVEFLVAEDGTVSFLEVNTRVQVEHPVTEATTGVDIVAWQFRIAAGERLDLPVDPDTGMVPATGHALEFRLNAEDVARGFVPSPGTVTRFEAPTGPGLRTDTGVTSGGTVPGFYDSLMAKLIVWGATREQALARARDALAETVIEGVATVLPFHRALVDHPDFTAARGTTAAEASSPGHSPAAGAPGDGEPGAGEQGSRFRVHTRWIETDFADAVEELAERARRADHGVGTGDSGRATFTIEIDGERHELGLPPEFVSALAAGTAGGASGTGGRASGARRDGNTVTSPYAGSLVSWAVEDGATVSAGDTVAVIEAMKMESPVTTEIAGRVRRADLSPGDTVELGTTLAVVEPVDDPEATR
ncbi:acetyl/propionyl/methylcrotonyl-CoA carboxylase subunit alpha [Brevibacterium litoralis]|uniref:acetyl/propionyl/methylcrotonyl-CoA carboxylase subunit alpha n=1 Tax=Brevibacterium litoralis TaxID=3138935 RepID=UPI0032EC18CA